MLVKLVNYTPVAVAVIAARTCTNTQYNYMNDDDKRVLQSVIKRGHESVIEHVSYTFEIKGVSRACLQEIARHRIASPSVQSTRFTLGKLISKKTTSVEIAEMLYQTGDPDIDTMTHRHLLELQELMIAKNLKNDIAKYALTEAFLTEMIWSINARAFKNFLRLRMAKAALNEIRLLATALLNEIPADHRILYPEFFNTEE